MNQNHSVLSEILENNLGKKYFWGKNSLEMILFGLYNLKLNLEKSN